MLASSDALAYIPNEFAPWIARWGLSLVLVILALLLGMLRPWAALIPGVFALSGIVDSFSDLQDTELMTAMTRVVGPNYIWHQFGAWTLAFLSSVLVFVVRFRRKKS
jgi:hypothetical protein